MRKFTTSLQDIKYKPLKELAKYWQKIKKDQPVPFRKQFNPVDVPQCLRYIVLVDVKATQPRYYVRLAGSSVNPVYHKSITGQFIENIIGKEDLESVLHQYDHTVTHWEPTYMTSTVNATNSTNMKYERVILPMTSDGSKVDKLLVGIIFENTTPAHIDCPKLKI